MNYFNDPPTTEKEDPNTVNTTVTGAGTNCYNTGFGGYCWNRLPCGICTRTNMICPLGGNSAPYPVTITYSNGTTTIENPYVSTGSTEGSVKHDG